MRELSVYYCPKCGRYGFFQLVRNAVCPVCGISMTLLDMKYQDFMHLDLDERDTLLIREIMAHSRSVSDRIAAIEQMHNHRELVARLNALAEELAAENKKLNDTVDWMHQTIWELLAKNRALEQQLKEDGR